jgi:hypothetical protein
MAGILVLGGAAAIACTCSAKRYLEGLYAQMEKKMKQSLAGIEQQMERIAADLFEQQTAEMKRTIELSQSQKVAAITAKESDRFSQ